MASERKERVKDTTKTSSQNNRKNGVAINIEAEGAGDNGVGGKIRSSCVDRLAL